MGCFEDGILNNYATITSADGNEYSFSLTANNDTSEDDDMLDIVINQLAIMHLDDSDQKIGVSNICYIYDLYDNMVFLKSRTGEEYMVGINSEDWYGLYRNDKPVMAKKNIFGRIKKNFW